MDSHLIYGISWTIFKVLWQGFLLAFILGGLKWFLRRKSAQLRYIISVTFLFMILGCTIINLASYEEKNINYEQGKINDLQFTNNQIAHFDISENIAPTQHSFTPVRFLFQDHELLKKYSTIIVLIWMIGVLISIIRFIYDILATGRLKKSGLIIENTRFQNMLISLSKLIGISKIISCLESSQIKSPIVIGYLKPVIILPIGFITSLPTDHIEAVLAHELAHIKRHDYLINIIQSIIEAVLFFHPGVWYISSVIRAERENCCDDMAIDACGESLSYAKALVNIQNLQLEKQYSAVAFSGRKNQLLNRIKRMTMKPKTKTNVLDKVIASIVVIIGIFIISYSAKARTEMNSNDDLSLKIQPALTLPIVMNKTDDKLEDITPPVRDTIDRFSFTVEDNVIHRTIKKDGKKQEIKIIMKDGVAKELYIDGEQIPEEEMDQYQLLIEETIIDLKNAQEDIEKTIQELETINEEEIQQQIQQALTQIEEFNTQDLMRQYEIALKEFHHNMDSIHKYIEEIHESVDYEEMLKHIQESLEDLKIDHDFDYNFDIGDYDFDYEYDYDFDYNDDLYRELLEKYQEEIKRSEEINTKELQKILENSIQEMNSEEIIKQLEKAKAEYAKAFESEDYTSKLLKDKEKVLKELEMQLKELEKLELEKTEK